MPAASMYARAKRSASRSKAREYFAASRVVGMVVASHDTSPVTATTTTLMPVFCRTWRMPCKCTRCPTSWAITATTSSSLSASPTSASVTTTIPPGSASAFAPIPGALRNSTRAVPGSAAHSTTCPKRRRSASRRAAGSSLASSEVSSSVARACSPSRRRALSGMPGATRAESQGMPSSIAK